ncbi:Protein of unknown function [Bacillus cereus]|uniref:Uncharacterized protein n=1 Tax=Bacillus wiedmannii TaxID=1890302 RepID=A0A1C4D1B2_9BACI|nr:Protein of unknown function [Bacillus wiedmannii]SCC28872.1 Protein of unknown function [Bacillus cereus]SCL94340.1 Protein of unknown function [Bacillus wiedmannii]SCN03693.1 Protein of unknown function [Bacillus wiedmannii]SCN44169.1 Protein of unknown function [Bacillus wiedmannii]
MVQHECVHGKCQTFSGA